MLFQCIVSFEIINKVFYILFPYQVFETYTTPIWTSHISNIQQPHGPYVTAQIQMIFGISLITGNNFNEWKKRCVHHGRLRKTVSVPCEFSEAGSVNNRVGGLIYYFIPTLFLLPQSPTYKPKGQLRTFKIVYNCLMNEMPRKS